MSCEHQHPDDLSAPPCPLCERDAEIERLRAELIEERRAVTRLLDDCGRACVRAEQAEASEQRHAEEAVALSAKSAFRGVEVKRLREEVERQKRVAAGWQNEALMWRQLRDAAERTGVQANAIAQKGMDRLRDELDAAIAENERAKELLRQAVPFVACLGGGAPLAKEILEVLGDGD